MSRTVTSFPMKYILRFIGKSVNLTVSEGVPKIKGFARIDSLRSSNRRPLKNRCVLC